MWKRYPVYYVIEGYGYRERRVVHVEAPSKREARELARRRLPSGREFTSHVWAAALQDNEDITLDPLEKLAYGEIK